LFFLPLSFFLKNFFFQKIPGSINTPQRDFINILSQESGLTYQLKIDFESIPLKKRFELVQRGCQHGRCFKMLTEKAGLIFDLATMEEAEQLKAVLTNMVN